MRQTYTTLNGDVLDLGALDDEQRAYFDRCVEAYHNGADWATLTELVSGPANPLLRETKGRMTNAV